MQKKNESSNENSSKDNQASSSIKEKETTISNKNNENIINKIHSIKATINHNNNSNKLNFIQRKNNFRRTKDVNTKIKNSRSKSKNKIITNSINKISNKNKIHNENENRNKEGKLNNNINFINNCSLNVHNLGKNNYFCKNTSNSNMNNNNIIITINNYNKITPTKFVNTTNLIENKIGTKYTQKKIKNTKKKEIQNSKKLNEKKTFNYIISGHKNYLGNEQNNICNNNIFYNQIIYNKNNSNSINNIVDDNNTDNLSINTYNTINKSNTLINNSNNTTNREGDKKRFVQKNNKYQENIVLKKKQLEMYSPLSFLKKNLEIDKKPLNNLQFKEKINNEDLSSFNMTNIRSKFNSTSELEINDKKVENTKTTDDKKDVNDNTEKDLSEIIQDKIEQNIKNKKQVSNILSTLNRIKNTKKLYKDKKIYGFSNINRKKIKPSLNTNRNKNSFFKTLPFHYFDKRGNSFNSLFPEKYKFNERLYYSRNNSKNSLSNSFNLNYKNRNKIRANTNNKQFIDRSFISENRDFNSIKKKSKNQLFLPKRANKDKINNLTIRNIKTERLHNKTQLNKELDDTISINTSNNAIKNSPVLIEIKKQMINDININKPKKTLSISTYLDTSINNKKIVDSYESSTIANIDKHCNSLLSKINKKIKLKENIVQKDEVKNSKIFKKIIANASLCRKGLNRPEEGTKINQDSLFKVKFADLNYSYYGVCDGHGPLGHLVSDFIKSNLTFIVYKQLKSYLFEKTDLNNKNNSENSLNLKEIDDSYIDFPKLFKESFLSMESKLLDNKTIELELSGSTCSSLLFCSDKIISANLGDSRAIKGYYNSNLQKWEYIPLTRDHKPSEKDEAERIKNCKGIIHPYIDDDKKYVGPDRVWNEGEELPGLAMSRSFGDEIAKRVGVFCEPEVKNFFYNNEDQFVVIASDGLWEYVSNEEVLQIVGKYHEKNDCDGAVSELYELSKERWMKYDDYIDDISVIVVFLGSIE